MRPLLPGLILLLLINVYCNPPGKTTTKTVKVDYTKKYHWKLAQTWHKDFPLLSETPLKFAEMVNTMSNGRLTIKVVPANIHRSPNGIFDMVKGGQYQMGHSSSYYWKGKDFRTVFFTTMPFGFIATESYAWFYYGGGMELMQRVYSRYNMLAYPGGNTGQQMGGWFKNEIRSLEDLKGLKMRIPGFAGEVIAKLGVTVVDIHPGELFSALERGTIDALEWVGPAIDLSMGFHKAAPFYYTGWHEPGAETQFLVNLKAYNQLPPDLKAILTIAMKCASYDMLSHATHLNAVNLEKIKKEFPDIKIKSFPESVLAKLKEENQKLLEEYGKKDPLAKEIIRSQLDYLKRVRKWTKIGDYSYLKDN